MEEAKGNLQLVFNHYDQFGDGELEVEQIQRLFSDLRIGGLSLPQVMAAVEYVCLHDTCDVSELHGLLMELDRRYFLIQDLVWEFSMLDKDQTNLISPDQAKWLVQSVHGHCYSNQRWENFILKRPIPGAGISFAEIELMLCNIPSKLDLQLEQIEQAKIKKNEEIYKASQIEKKQLKKSKIYNVQREAPPEQEVREVRPRKKEPKNEEHIQVSETQQPKQTEEQQFEESNNEEMDVDTYENVEQLAQEEAKLEKQADIDLKSARAKKESAKNEQLKKEAEDKEKDAAKRKSDHKKKRIRYNLKVAIKSRDKFQLTHSIKEFSDEKLDDHEMDLAKAQRILKELTVKDDLHKAMSKREIADLEAAMETVKKHGYETKLAKEMTAANKILSHLRRLERIRHEILELKQATVAEIRSYQKPLPVVHSVMTCTFLLLGHSEKETANWKAVQGLVGKTGKESLKRRCLGCDPSKFDATAVKRCKKMLKAYELDEVRDVSAGAATFYVWSTAMIEDYEQRASQTDDT